MVRGGCKLARDGLGTSLEGLSGKNMSGIGEDNVSKAPVIGT